MSRSDSEICCSAAARARAFSAATLRSTGGGSESDGGGSESDAGAPPDEFDTVLDASRAAWQATRNMAEFRRNWMRFYLGPSLMTPLCLAPGYVGAEDNPHASPAQAAMFAALTARDLICTGSQSGGADGQRAFITLFTGCDHARRLVDEFNRRRGVYATAQAAGADGAAAGPAERFVAIVTYGGGSGGERLSGHQRTGVDVTAGADELAQLASWLEPDFRREFLAREWWYVTLVDADHSRDNLLEAVHAYVLGYCPRPVDGPPR